MKYTRWIVAALIVLILSSHVDTHAQSTLDAANTVYLPTIMTASTNAQSLEQHQFAQQVLALVNSERATAGCAPLAMNDRLVAAAQRQSQDMAEHNFFSHTNPDPARATVGQRASAAGYRWSLLGENIAAGHSSPHSVMYYPEYGWMESAGHRANILNCDFTEIGVGYYYEVKDQASLPDYDQNGAPDGPYYRYWTQVFGKP